MDIEYLLKEVDEDLTSKQENVEKIYQDLVQQKTLSVRFADADKTVGLFLLCVLSNLNNRKALLLTQNGKDIYSQFNKYLDNLLLPYTIKYAEDEESLIGYLNTFAPNIILTSASVILKLVEDFEAEYLKEYFSCELGLLAIDERLKDTTESEHLISGLTLCMKTICSFDLYVINTSNETVESESISIEIKKRFLLLALIHANRNIWKKERIEDIWNENVEELLEEKEGIEFYGDEFQLIDVEKLKTYYLSFKNLRA